MKRLMHRADWFGLVELMLYTAITVVAVIGVVYQFSH